MARQSPWPWPPPPWAPVASHDGFLILMCIAGARPAAAVVARAADRVDAGSPSCGQHQACARTRVLLRLIVMSFCRVFACFRRVACVCHVVVAVAFALTLFLPTSRWQGARSRRRRGSDVTRVRPCVTMRAHGIIAGSGYAPGLSVGTLPPSRLVFLCAVRMARAHVSSPDIACVSAGRCIIHTEFLPRDAHSPSRRLGSTQGGQKPTYFARTPRRIAGRRRSPLERWRRRRSRQGLNGHCRRPRRHPS